MSGTLKEQVSEAIEVGAAPVPAETLEIASSPTEVKTEVATEPVAPTTEIVSDVNKDKEIASNLNIALKEEREGRKADRIKLQELEDFKKKMEGVFAPPPEEVAEAPQPKYLTQEDLDRIFQENEQKRINETETAKKMEVVVAEVKRMETTWNGENGKPKYDDQEVLSWQQNNGKLYLTPEEAFFQMKRSDIIDYEAKQVLSGKKISPDATQPTSMPGSHEPAQTLPKTPKELRDAVREAISQDDAS